MMWRHGYGYGGFVAVAVDALNLFGMDLVLACEMFAPHILSSDGVRAQLLHSLWALSSLTRDWTRARCSGNAVLTQDHQGSP